jgi:hypothetical protein
MAHFEVKKDNYLCNRHLQLTYEFQKSYEFLIKYNKIILKTFLKWIFISHFRKEV